MIAHLLSTVPFVEVELAALKFPKRPPSDGYRRPPKEHTTFVPDHAATLG